MMLAMKQVEHVTQLNFRTTNDPKLAEFRLITFDDDDYLGFMVPPGEPYAGIGGMNKSFLDWIDADSRNSLFERGGFGFAIMLEEIGHGLGLAHPHDDGGSSKVLAGVTEPLGSYGVGDLNQGIFTVMGYNEGWPGGPYGRKYLDPEQNLIYINDFGYEATMSGLDVAVLQSKYGTNPDTATGDNTYRLPDSNGRGTFFRCIWDAGGKDKIVYDGDRDATIDLRPATLKGEAGGGGFVSWAKYIRGGFTIASGVTIENATGGAGDDVLIGNAAVNRLLGGKGRDRLDGGSGRDVMKGGPDNDTYVVDNSRDEIVEKSGAGSDRVLSSAIFRLPSQVEKLTLLGDAAIDGTGNAKANLIKGNSAANRLLGDRGADALYGRDGADWLDGGDGLDTMVGGRGDDTYVVGRSDEILIEKSGGGYDSVRSSASFRLPSQVEKLTLLGDAAIDGTGNAKANLIKGNGAANRLLGDRGADVLYGRDGADWIDGGDGLDTMVGGRGDDTYVVGRSDEIVIEKADGGYDSVRSSASFKLPDDVEELFLIGAGDIDGVGNDYDNLIVGNDGGNRLTGGLGADRLEAGEGSDVFVFAHADESRPGTERDVIAAFESGLDKIDVSAIDADSEADGDQSFVFIGVAAFSGTTGELRYEAGIVAGETSGDRVADFEIGVEDLAALVAVDFVL